MRDRPHATENEEARLNVLRNLRLLDTPPSESFDRITRMASRLLNAPISTISLTDRDRQWFKSRVGTEVTELPRERSPCNYAIRKDEVFVVPDLQADPRFSGGPVGEAGMRFYAGAPLITRSGYSLGTLCVVDMVPRTFNEDEARVLADLANLVMTQIEVQNSIGRVHPTSGIPNEYQLLEDLEDMALRSPGQPQVALMVEMVASRHLSQGMRVLGANFVEHLVQGSTDAIRAALGQRSRLYHIGATRCAVLLEPAAAGSWKDAVQALDRHLRAPIACSGVPVRPDPAIGVYEFDAGQVTPRSVLRRLYNAVGDARDAGIALACYDESHDHTHTRRFQLLGSLGTGYSSLAYMQKIPANVLKIDRSFMQALSSSERDQKLVRSMIAMAHELDYRVAAEGIETGRSFELLSGWGCDEAQGYFFARPLPADGLSHWLRTWRASAPSS